MGKASAPPPPDYAALARQQGAANKETAVAEFMLNNANQVTPYGTRTLTKTGPGEFDYTMTTALNADDQKRLDQTRQIQAGLLSLAPSALNNVWNSIGNTPVAPDNLPPMSYNVDTSGGERLDFSGLPSAAYGVEGGNIQNSLDFSGAPALMNPDALRQQVSNAQFNQFMSRFAPAAQQQVNTLNTRIANMGGVSDSDAARRQMSGLLTTQGDQVRQASWDAINKGGEEAQRQFGMNLGARQQAVGEIGQQGQFANAAQEQGFSQGQANAALRNSAIAQTAGLMQTQNQLNNTLNQQQIQNAFANANLGNAARAQGLTEMSSLRQMPLNELMALLNGTQVQQPTFQPVTSTNIAPAPIFQAGQAQAQAAQQAYATQAGQSNSTMGTVGTIGAAALMAF